MVKASRYSSDGCGVVVSGDWYYSLMLVMMVMMVVLVVMAYEESEGGNVE